MISYLQPLLDHYRLPVYSNRKLHPPFSPAHSVHQLKTSQTITIFCVYSTIIYIGSRAVVPKMGGGNIWVDGEAKGGRQGGIRSS